LKRHAHIHILANSIQNNNININAFVIVINYCEGALAYLNIWQGTTEEERLKEVFGREREKDERLNKKKQKGGERR